MPILSKQQWLIFNALVEANGNPVGLDALLLKVPVANLDSLRVQVSHMRHRLARDGFTIKRFSGYRLEKAQ